MARGRSLTIALLLDEMISPAVARSLRERGIDAVGLQEFEGGRLLSKTDAEILRAALTAGRALVTFDLATVPLVLRGMRAAGETHAGVVFVSTKTIATHELGPLTVSLENLVVALGEASLAGRELFLARHAESGPIV